MPVLQPAKESDRYRTEGGEGENLPPAEFVCRQFGERERRNPGVIILLKYFHKVLEFSNFLIIEDSDIKKRKWLTVFLTNYSYSIIRQVQYTVCTVKIIADK